MLTFKEVDEGRSPLRPFVLSTENTRITSMPKLKTHKGAAKRFKKTASGAFKRGKANARHLFAGKSNANKRRLGQAGTVSSANHQAVCDMLPYA